MRKLQCAKHEHSLAAGTAAADMVVGLDMASFVEVCLDSDIPDCTKSRQVVVN